MRKVTEKNKVPNKKPKKQSSPKRSHWVGYWYQGIFWGKMDCELIQGNGEIYGSGVDFIGNFTWKGKTTGGKVLMTKHYTTLGYNVEYNGIFKKDKKVCVFFFNHYYKGNKD